MGNRIRDWHDGFEPEGTISVALHHSSPIWQLPIRILDIIVAGRISLPDINLDAVDGVALRVVDCAKDKTWLPFWVM